MISLFNENMSLEEKRLVFLNDTINFYSTDVSRRSVYNLEEEGYTDTKCYYHHPDGKRKCAIGRWFNDDKYDTRYDQNGGLTVRAIINKDEDVLPQEIIELDVLFLLDIQSLHDQDRYWDKNGLTEKGIDKVNLIKKQYNLGE